MRRFLLLFLAIMPLGLSAQSNEQPRFNTLVITLTDGTKEKILLLTEPRITYQDSLFVVTTAMETKTFPRNKVKGYRFTLEDANGVEIVPAANAQQVEWQLEGRALHLRRLPKDSIIKLFTVNGQHIMSTRRSGRCSLNLSRFASGIYMLEVNGQFIKIVLS